MFRPDTFEFLVRCSTDDASCGRARQIVYGQTPLGLKGPRHLFCVGTEQKFTEQSPGTDGRKYRVRRAKGVGQRVGIHQQESGTLECHHQVEDQQQRYGHHPGLGPVPP